MALSWHVVLTLTHDTDIVTCHNMNLTRGNNKILQKKKFKKSESDLWRAVNDVIFV